MLQAPRSLHTRPLAREVKFLVPAGIAADILTVTRQTMHPDPHGSGPDGDEYTVTSLYLDSPARDVYYRRGSSGRGKYRVRRYGAGDQVFLERKLRTSHVLIKRRTAITLDRLEGLNGATGVSAAPESWFMRRIAVRGLVPTCQVTYRRVARLSTTPHGLVRLTCDREIDARAAETLRFHLEPGVPVQRDWQILEMKFQGEPPALFKRLASEFALVPRLVSKYRLSLEALDRSGVPPMLSEVDAHA